jgi:hypothetical protein
VNRKRERVITKKKKEEKEFAKAGPIKRRKCGLNALS